MELRSQGHDSSFVAAPTRSVITSLYSSLSASYATGQDWSGKQQRNYAFLGNVLYRHSSFATNRNHSHQAMADLGYLKFVDSLWVKNLDRLQINLLWGASRKRFSRSYMASLGTQFLPSMYSTYDHGTGRIREQPVGGFMNPFHFEAGYGAVLTFWNTSTINFAFATVRLNSSPKETTPAFFVDSRTIEGSKAYYFLTYGFSISTAINKPFGDRVRWINNARLFGNGIDRDHVTFDLTNMIVVKLWKYIQLRADTRLNYNPILSYNMQFRQEVLVGFFYERNK
jgi:hypothetical protein